MFNNFLKHRIKEHIIFLGISLLFIFPFFYLKGSLYGFDLFFHIDRMLGLSNVLKSPINYNTFFNLGQGVNIFYPWLTLYPMFILYKITNSVYWSFIIFLFMLTYLLLILSSYLAVRISGSTKVGLIYSILYAFSAYRVDNIISRFALGEVISFTFLPLVFLGLFEIAKGNYKKWPYLTLGMSLLMYSHILSVILSTIVIGLVILFSFYFWNEKSNRLKSLLLSVISTIFATSFVWTGILQQYLKLKITSPQKINLNEYSKSVSDIVLESLNNDLTTHSMGMIVIILFIIVLFNFTRFSNEDRFYSIISIILFIAMTDIMPWGVAKILHLDIIQYPYRLTIYLTLFILLIGSKVLVKVDNKILTILFLVIVFIHVGSLFKIIRSNENNSNFVAARELSVRNDLYSLTHSFKQYDYANVINGTEDKISEDRRVLFEHQVLADEQIIKSENLFYDNTAIFKFSTVEPGKVRLPIYYYVGQIITDNGNIVSSKVSNNGSTEIMLRNSGNHEISVKTKYTILQRIAALVSVMTFFYLFKKSKWKRQSEKDVLKLAHK